MGAVQSKVGCAASNVAEILSVGLQLTSREAPTIDLNVTFWCVLRFLLLASVV